MSGKPKLQLENTQKLVVTPKLRQALTILQLPSYELANYLQQELAANPVLELERPWEELAGDDPYQAQDVFGQEWLEYWFDESTPQPRAQREQAAKLPVDRWQALGQDKLQEVVLQIRISDATAQLQELAVSLLEQLDRSGFLPHSDEELAQIWATTAAGVKQARRLLQSLEPRGLGCYGLADYLCLELQARGKLSPCWQEAITSYLPLLAAGQVAQVAVRLGCPAAELQELLDLLPLLPARPGGELTPGRQNQLVLPDVVVNRVWGSYEVQVNERALPHLALSPYYLRLVQETEEPEVKSYVADRIRAATWLVRSLEQRQQTLHNVALAIVAGQHGFLEHGLSALRPLTLAQVATSLDIHESTVSRAIDNKYLQTPRGLYPMRFFFTSGVADDSGFGLAKAGVQMAIRRLIATEDSSAPWSDQAIADVLRQEQGIRISRRTVGKYREELGILSSQRRKRFQM